MPPPGKARKISSSTRTNPTPSTSRSALNDNDSGSSTVDIEEEERSNYEVEKVVDKKVYKNKIYYKLKWVGWEEPTWELAENCSCELLINQYEQMVEEQSKDEDEDEWEVQEIIDKRTKSDETEYLVKWRNWQGDPTWVKEKDCECVNLIAAFENPKLRKMWNFHGSNTRLWLDREAILKYMSDYAEVNRLALNLLEFEPDFPPGEKPHELIDGINIGPVSYKHHWYLVIILVNHICITKKILICDPLNTLIGVPNTRVHPVFKRISNIYKGFTMAAIAMTPQERSDTCAFYILAAFERAMFCLNKSASFIVNKLFFDHSKPELIRSRTAPDSNHEISVNLVNNSSYLDGPKCEFCSLLGESSEDIDRHIIDEHFTIPNATIKALEIGPGTNKKKYNESDRRGEKETESSLKSNNSVRFRKRSHRILKESPPKRISL